MWRVPSNLAEPSTHCVEIIDGTISHNDLGGYLWLKQKHLLLLGALRVLHFEREVYVWNYILLLSLLSLTSTLIDNYWDKKLFAVVTSRHYAIDGLTKDGVKCIKFVYAPVKDTNRLICVMLDNATINKLKIRLYELYTHAKCITWV